MARKLVLGLMAILTVLLLVAAVWGVYLFQDFRRLSKHDRINKLKANGYIEQKGPDGSVRMIKHQPNGKTKVILVKKGSGTVTGTTVGTSTTTGTVNSVPSTAPVPPAKSTTSTAASTTTKTSSNASKKKVVIGAKSKKMTVKRKDKSNGKVKVVVKKTVIGRDGKKRVVKSKFKYKKTRVTGATTSSSPSPSTSASSSSSSSSPSSSPSPSTVTKSNNTKVTIKTTKIKHDNGFSNGCHCKKGSKKVKIYNQKTGANSTKVTTKTTKIKHGKRLSHKCHCKKGSKKIKVHNQKTSIKHGASSCQMVKKKTHHAIVHKKYKKHRRCCRCPKRGKISYAKTRPHTANVRTFHHKKGQFVTLNHTCNGKGMSYTMKIKMKHHKHPKHHGKAKLPGKHRCHRHRRHHGRRRAHRHHKRHSHHPRHYRHLHRGRSYKVHTRKCGCPPTRSKVAYLGKYQKHLKRIHEVVVIKVYKHCHHDLYGNKHKIHTHHHKQKHHNKTIHSIKVKKHKVMSNRHYQPLAPHNKHDRKLGKHHGKHKLVVPPHVYQENKHFFAGFKDIFPIGDRMYHEHRYQCWGNVPQDVAFDPKYYGQHRNIVIEVPKDQAGHRQPITAHTRVTFCVRKSSMAP